MNCIKVINGKVGKKLLIKSKSFMTMMDIDFSYGNNVWKIMP